MDEQRGGWMDGLMCYSKMIMTESRWIMPIFTGKCFQLCCTFEIFHNKILEKNHCSQKPRFLSKGFIFLTSPWLLLPSVPQEKIHCLRVWLLGLSKTCKLKKAPCCM